MNNAKRRIERHALAAQLQAIDESMRNHLSQAQRSDTHREAYAHYATIQELATTAQSLVVILETFDSTPVQEAML
jgi:hypothetical protein